MKITIIGGGNIGTLAAAKISLNHDVTLYTNKSWNNIIEVYNHNNELLYKSNYITVTADIKSAIEDADIIISTYPSNLTENIIKEINKFQKRLKYLILEPGFGGKEFHCSNLIEKGVTIIGMQRVHAISRIKETGKSVYFLGGRKCLNIASIPNSNNKESKLIMEELFENKTNILPNYLCVTLTPSNSILHTARLYSMFNNNEYYEKDPLFYEEWNDSASEILFKSDDEEQRILKCINKIDLTSVESLKKYYESETPKKLTKKIKSIEAFKGISSPTILTEKGFTYDLKSRYFFEDFPYGILIIKGFAEICNIDTPQIDEIINWYQQISNKEYLIDNKLKGKDLIETGIPQNYGLKKVEDIYKYYV